MQPIYQRRRLTFNILHRRILGNNHRCENLKSYIKEPLLPDSASKLYRQSDCRLSAKLVSTFAGRECRVVSVTDPYGRFLALLNWSNPTYNAFIYLFICDLFNDAVGSSKSSL
jgi:hypothetical protein